MTENDNKNGKSPFTHSAWIKKTDLIRKGRRVGRWVDEGVARMEPDGSINLYLHSLPIGGFDGHIFLGLIGNGPPDITPSPQRPGASGDHDGSEEESEA